MADEPERRPESSADSEADEDDVERDALDSDRSGRGDETPESTGETAADSDAPGDDRDDEGTDADSDPDRAADETDGADGADETDAADETDDADDADETDAAADADDGSDDADHGNFSKGAEEDSHEFARPDDEPAPTGDADRPTPDPDSEGDGPDGESEPTGDDAPSVIGPDGEPIDEDGERSPADDGPTPRTADGEPVPEGEPVPVDEDGNPIPEAVDGEMARDADGDPVKAEGDGGAVSVDRPDNMAETTAVERKTGPASDEEMPLADHIEEMVTRLFVVIAIGGVVSVAVFPFGEEVIDFLWYSVLPGGDIAQPRVYHPLALILTQLKVASLAGLIVALPVFVYETYEFMRPGLYPNERRYYLASVPMSLVLALVGVTFAYFVVLPAIFTYFLYYSEGVTTIAFALSDTFNLILLLMGYLALVFQIPLFIMLAIMMGLTTRRWLQDRRLYFWGGFLGVAFLFSPDPTGMAPILVATTMVVLFEGTLLLLRWTGR